MILSIPLAILPSIIWLLFFLSQDRQPEPRRAIIRIFIWGILVAAPVVIAEELFARWVSQPLSAVAGASFVSMFIGVAFIEEAAKYLVVRWKAVPYRFFNEPQDAMLYMITAALGFAAIENIYYVVQADATTYGELIQFIGLRAVSATFLHALASGVLGYFLALAILRKKEYWKFFVSGLVGATLLHGVYNSFIINMDNLFADTKFYGILNITALLFISGFIIIYLFQKLTWLKISHFSKN